MSEILLLTIIGVVLLGVVVSVNLNHTKIQRLQDQWFRHDDMHAGEEAKSMVDPMSQFDSRWQMIDSVVKRFIKEMDEQVRSLRSDLTSDTLATRQKIEDVRDRLSMLEDRLARAEHRAAMKEHGDE